MNKKGFTLIELLAVIIILGILMIIAIPSVTKYISDSRKEAYVKTAKQVVSGARNLVNEGKLEMYDTSATYYIPNSCIRVENGEKAKSPYGEFTKAYVVVTYDGKGYDYYWTSVDEAGIGVKNIISINELDIDDIESDLKIENVSTGNSIQGKSTLFVIDENDCTTLTDGSLPIIGTLSSALEEATEEGLLTAYNGNHQDTMAGPGDKQIMTYYTESTSRAEKIRNNWNIVFANFCWQMIRTTDTGGIKIIYNGKPDSEGRCGRDTGTHFGFKSARYKTFTGTYYYGTKYIYDEAYNEFSLSGELKQSWWDATTYKDLVGMYTCMSNDPNEKCSELYYTYPYYYQGNSNAFVGVLSNSVPNKYIANTAFSGGTSSIAYVGYMYNKVYDGIKKTIENSSNYLYSNDFEYRNGKYYLKDPINILNFSTNENLALVNNHHYTCFNDTGECESIAYIFSTFNRYAYHILLTDGKDATTAFNEMLYANDVNVYDSTAKKLIDEWYEKNMTNYTRYLEDVIFCNDRTTANIAGWDPNGGDGAGTVMFYEYPNYGQKDLYCRNETDRFSVSNPKARLKYPVGLLTTSEVNLLGYDFRGGFEVRSEGYEYWLMSPYRYQISAYTRFVSSGGTTNYNTFYSSAGLRPVVSLKPGTGFVSGDGSLDNPYVVR